MAGSHLGAKKCTTGVLTLKTSALHSDLHSNSSENQHLLLALYAAALSLIVVFIKKIPYLITKGFVDEFFGAGYQPSARAIAAKHRFLSAVLDRFVTVQPDKHFKVHRLVHRAAGRQGHASRRPARKAARTQASGGDDGDGGGDGEPPHRVRLTSTPEYLGGGA